MTSQLLHSWRAIPVAKACSSFPVGFSLLNHADRQFAAFYDEEHRITVASRLLGSDGWTFAKPEGPWLLAPIIDLRGHKNRPAVIQRALTGMLEK